MANHNLKSFTRHFQVVKDGLKRSEVRLNDRGYKIGDTITLHEGQQDIAAGIDYYE